MRPTSTFLVPHRAPLTTSDTVARPPRHSQFCAACGSPVCSSWAGWKLTCSSLLPWADNTGKKPCATATGLHNFAHPRTDAVVIMAVVNEAGDKILLGRNVRPSVSGRA